MDPWIVGVNGTISWLRSQPVEIAGERRVGARGLQDVLEKPPPEFNARKQRHSPIYKFRNPRTTRKGTFPVSFVYLAYFAVERLFTGGNEGNRSRIIGDGLSALETLLRSGTWAVRPGWYEGAPLALRLICHPIVTKKSGGNAKLLF
jgi:hypothetical protein